MISDYPWDESPITQDYKGRNYEFYTRGDLALALNRSTVTIRSMERKGVLSHPRLRNRRGWWLYTHDQIVDLVKLARDEGVLDPDKKQPYSNRFISQARAILIRLPQ